MISAPKYIIYWLQSGIILIFMMVFVGGITRLTHSGLSIVEWDLFSEAKLSFTSDEWDNLFKKYKQTPEFKYINADFSVEDFKSIFWWEYIHRMLGRLIGLVFLIPYVVFTIQKKISLNLHKRLIIILLLGAFQGFLGWYMVKSGLVNEPAVSHYRLAAHLINAFLTCAYIYWVILEIKFPSFRESISKNAKIIVYILSLLILTQIVWGAFVAGLKAGFTLNTFPKMGNEWFPSILFPINFNILINSVIGVQFVHRMLAYTILLLSILLIFKIKNQRNANQIKKWFYQYSVLLLIQIILGIFTIIFSVPIVLGLLHQTVGFLVLLSVTRLIYLLR